jgi:hypothetical protein
LFFFFLREGIVSFNLSCTQFNKGTTVPPQIKQSMLTFLTNKVSLEKSPSMSANLIVANFSFSYVATGVTILIISTALSTVDSFAWTEQIATRVSYAIVIMGMNDSKKVFNHAVLSAEAALGAPSVRFYTSSIYT